MSALELEHFGVRIGQRVILHDISFVVPDRGVVALMGPGGSGKSTLLRAVTEHAGHSSFMRVGEARVANTTAVADGRGILVRQRLELATQTVLEVFAGNLDNRGELTQLQQREVISAHLERLGCAQLADHFGSELSNLPSHVHCQVRIAAGALSGPVLMCIDEPTAAVEDREAADVLALVARVGEDCGVLLATHNQRHARQVADYVGLLAAGRLVEFGVTAQFFDAPVEEATRQYLKTGGCSLPSPNATSLELDESFRDSASFALSLEEPTESDPIRLSHAIEESRPGARYVSGSAGPRGFRWLIPGQLAGTPYPGIVDDVEQDIEALRRVGVTHLVTLTEQPANFSELASSYGLQIRFFPIDDMEAPDADRAYQLCTDVRRWLDEDSCVAFHCKAGLGRTGTMLAAYLVFVGADADEALRTVRSAHSKWVQSKVQEAFLEQFSRHVNGTRREPTPHTEEGAHDVT